MVFYILLAALLILAIASLFGARKFVNMVVHPKVHEHEDYYEIMKNGPQILDCRTFLDDKQTESFTYQSQYGYTLRGLVVRNPNMGPKDRAIILCHGYTGCYTPMMRYAKLFYELGFSVVLYDHRWHGHSDKTDNAFCSMARFESDDLVGIAAQVRDLFSADCTWGVLGESMGAATVMLASYRIPNLAYACEDCGFSTMRGEMENTLKNMHLPNFPFIQLGNLMLKKKYGFSLDEVRPVDAMAKTDIPMLFCHGDNDTFVPTDMIYDVFNAKKDKKQMKLFSGSQHAKSLLDHPEEYRETVEGFLKSFDLI